MLSHKIHFVFFTVLDCTPPFQVSVITDAKEDTLTAAAQTVLSRGKKGVRWVIGFIGGHRYQRGHRDHRLSGHWRSYLRNGNSIGALEGNR